MVILVTGGLGVNGSWVVRELLELGHRPLAMDVRRDFSYLKDIEADVEFVQGDVTDLRGMLNLVREHRVEAIAHLGARIRAEHDPYAGAMTNTVGSMVMLEVAKLCNVRRFVFTSSKAVYAPAAGGYGPPSYDPISEDYPIAIVPTWRVYGSSKIHVEALGQQHAANWGLEFVALRFASIFGPGKEARHGPAGTHSWLIEGALRGETIRLDHGADQSDDIVYVKDVAQGIVKALIAPRPAKQAYNIGSGRHVTYRALAGVIRRHVPGASLEIGAGMDPMNVGGEYYPLLDITRARADLGYEPRFDLEAGVADYIDVVRRFNLLPVTSS